MQPGKQVGVSHFTLRRRQGKGMFIFLPWSCIMAALVLEIWIGLGSQPLHPDPATIPSLYLHAEISEMDYIS